MSIHPNIKPVDPLTWTLHLIFGLLGSLYRLLIPLYGILGPKHGLISLVSHPYM